MRCEVTAGGTDGQQGIPNKLIIAEYLRSVNALLVYKSRLRRGAECGGAF